MRWEYDLEKISARSFERVAFFCSEKGDCALEDLPMDQMGVLRDFLNHKGAEGWELVQLFFQEDGVVAFWKRPKIF